MRDLMPAFAEATTGETPAVGQGAFTRGTPLKRGLLLTYTTSALVYFLHLFWCVLLIPPKRPRQFAGFLFAFDAGTRTFAG